MASMTSFFLGISGPFIGNRDIVSMPDQDSLGNVKDLEDRELELGQFCYSRQISISSSAGLVSFKCRAEGQQA